MSKASTSSVALAASERSGEAANATGAPAPDPEVTARPIRRRFTAEYKCSVLDQAEAAQQVGAVGALLRREGLYSSLLSTWRRQRKQGEFDALRNVSTSLRQVAREFRVEFLLSSLPGLAG
jgi:hypothetical protein